MVVALTLLAPAAAVGSPTQAPPDPKTELEVEKLRQEVRKLQLENDNADGYGAAFLRWAPLLTIVGGVFAILISIRKEVREQRTQRESEMNVRQKELDHRVAQAKLEQKQREDELKQRRAEAQRRFDELFAQAVANLGSDKESVQLSAVVVLDGLLRHEGAEFGEQVYWVVCANLPLRHTPLVNRFLVRTFAKGVRLRLAGEDGERREPLDLANCFMPRINLERLPLRDADVAFATLRDARLAGADLARLRGYEVDLERAWLTGANLTEARLHGAQCSQAKFHEATLVSAEFKAAKSKRADLSQAEFFRARMQGSHFEGADLTGASFGEANISDAYFFGATFDESALWSLLETAMVGDGPSWRKAHFDDAVTLSLERMSTQHRPRRRRRPRSSTPLPEDGPVESGVQKG